MEFLRNFARFSISYPASCVGKTHITGETIVSLDQALKKITTGIYIVTSKLGSEINGMVASWVSFFPPLIMVAIKKEGYSFTIPFEIKKSGAPVIKDALAFLDCRLVVKFEPSDHTIFIGEVLEGDIVEEGNPLSSNDLKSTYGEIVYS